MNLRFVSRRNLAIAAAVAAIPLASVMTTVQSAQASEVPTQIFTYAHKCVDLNGGKANEGQLIHEWTCNNTVAQNFTFPSAGNGYVNIKTSANKCVQMADSFTPPGRYIARQFTCNGATSQFFKIVPLGNGYVNIKTWSNLCLDVKPAPFDGAFIDELPCNNQTEQYFVVNQ
jgi:hypothetical protein